MIHPILIRLGRILHCLGDQIVGKLYGRIQTCGGTVIKTDPALLYHKLCHIKEVFVETCGKYKHFVIGVTVGAVEKVFQTHFLP